MEEIFHAFTLIGSTDEPQYSQYLFPKVVMGAPQFGHTVEATFSPAFSGSCM